jgi:N-acetyl-alpha-D-glucosaminyl L-malate synthase BshA
VKPSTVGMVCFSSLGGSGVVASELAHGLARRGHRVHLLADGMPSRFGALGAAVRFHRIDAPAYPALEHAPYTLAVAASLASLARAERPDVLHLHYAVPHAVSGYLASQMLGADAPAIVVTLHGSDVTHAGADPAYAAPTRFALSQVHGLTAPSAFLKGLADRQLAGGDTPVEVIPNFVDIERFAPAEVPDRGRFDRWFATPSQGALVLVHMSNFRPVKRPTDLVEVLARLRQRRPARLVLVGDGPLRGTTQHRVEALGLQDHVAFTGPLPGFAAELRHADAFMLPSELESFGVAALEALACGVPVVAYRVGGLPEVVPPEAGRLVPLGDVTAMSQAVDDLTRDATVHAAARRAARAQAAGRFGLTAALDAFEAHYERAVARRWSSP